MPDLAFISQYSKEIPRSRTVSPAPIVPQQSVTPNPSTTINTNKTDNERRRTLKSIKRYKSSKHSTEPLNVFFSPQLGKTFAAVPASAIFTEGNDGTTVIKMKITPPSSQTNSSLKSCLKYGSRANSCDIQAMLDDGRTGSSFNLPQPIENQVRQQIRILLEVESPNFSFSSSMSTLHHRNDVAQKPIRHRNGRMNFSEIVKCRVIIIRNMI